MRDGDRDLVDLCWRHGRSLDIGSTRRISGSGSAVKVVRCWGRVLARGRWWSGTRPLPAAFQIREETCLLAACLSSMPYFLPSSSSPKSLVMIAIFGNHKYLFTGISLCWKQGTMMKQLLESRKIFQWSSRRGLGKKERNYKIRHINWRRSSL